MIGYTIGKGISRMTKFLLRSLPIWKSRPCHGFVDIHPSRSGSSTKFADNST